MKSQILSQFSMKALAINFACIDEDDQQNFGGHQELEEDPYQNDEQTYQEHFRKTFITENQKGKMGGAAGASNQESKQIWTLHDMIIPAGKTAKLIRIKNPRDPDFRVSEICDKLKFVK